jgi:hypothetical protein
MIPMLGRPQYRKVGYREKRKDRRILFPNIQIQVEGATFETADWSFGGFRVESSDVRVAVGDPIEGTLGWGGVRFPFSGRVTRIGGDTRELAVGFTEISDAAMLYLDRRLSEYLTTQKRARS